MSVFERVQTTVANKRVAVPAHQVSSHPLNKSVPYSTWVSTTPTSAPAFGSTIQIDFKEIGIVQQNVLHISVSGITGATNAKFAVAPYMIRRMEYLNAAGQTLKIVQSGDENFVVNQVFSSDEARAEYGVCVGPYDDATRRITNGSNAQTFFIPLECPFKASGTYAVLGPQHAWSVRIEFTTLEQVVSYSAQTALACSISSVLLFTNIVRLPEVKLNEMQMELSSHGCLAHKCNDILYQSNTIQAGVSSAQFLLNGIQGKVGLLFFVIRRADTLYDDNYTVFSQIASYSLTDATQTSLVGLSSITHKQNALLINRNLSESTYLLQGGGMSSTDNNANVYIVPFDPNPYEYVKHAIHSNCRRFTGTELLTLNFISSLLNPYQVDIYAFVEGVLMQTPSGVSKQYA